MRWDESPIGINVIEWAEGVMYILERTGNLSMIAFGMDGKKNLPERAFRL